VIALSKNDTFARSLVKRIDFGIINDDIDYPPMLKFYSLLPNLEYVGVPSRDYYTSM
jgi:hypothetical protein